MGTNEELSGASLAEVYQAIVPRYPEFKGQVAIVTGSGRGIGRGIAMRLAREGMRVVIAGLEEAEVTATSEELQKLGAEVLPVAGDLGQEEAIDSLFQQAIAAYGTVDLLVNNAAILRRRPFFEAGSELLDAQLGANVRAPYLCALRASEIMRDNGKGGNIISLSSVGGLRAHWRGLPYDLTKGAIDAMTRAMALELCQYNIRVNAIAPGAILTDTIRHLRTEPEIMQTLTQRVPIQRFGVPQDIAASVTFLASPEASYITGQVLYVDGGLVAQLTPRGQEI